MQVLKGRKKGQGSGCVVDSAFRRNGMMPRWTQRNDALVTCMTQP
jgi:hypothetical protein